MPCPPNSAHTRCSTHTPNLQTARTFQRIGSTACAQAKPRYTAVQVIRCCQVHITISPLPCALNRASTYTYHPKTILFTPTPAQRT